MNREHRFADASLLTAGAICFAAVCMFVLLWFSKSVWMISADEYLRTLEAWSWVQEPTLPISGIWLPFHEMLLGTGLAIWPDLMLVPRLMTLTVGLVAIIGTFKSAELLAPDRPAAPVLASLLLSSHFLFLILTAVPLTETWIMAVCAVACYATLRYQLLDANWGLAVAAGALFLGNGIRYDCWYLTLLWNGWVVVTAWRRGALPTNWRARIKLLGLLALPWVMPIVWLIGNAVVEGDPFYFSEVVKRNVEDSVFGDSTSWSRVTSLVESLATLSGPIVIAGLLGLSSKVTRVDQAYDQSTETLTRDIIWGACIMTLLTWFTAFFGAYPMFLPARMFAPGLILWIIPAGLVLTQLFTHSPGRRAVATLLATFALVGSLYNIERIPSGPSEPIREVGRFLEHQFDRAPGKVLVEKRYWSYVYLAVASNHPDRIVWDRLDERFDMKPTQLPRRLKENPDYLSENEIAVVVTASPKLGQYVNRLEQTEEVGRIQNWRIFRVDAD